MPRLKPAPKPRRFLRRSVHINAAPSTKVPMAQWVTKSARTCSTVRSKTPRFARRRDKAVATAAMARYNTHVGNRASIANLHSREKRGAFGTAPRFTEAKPARPASAAAAQPSVHITAGMAEAVAASGRRYAVMRSATPRFRRRSTSGTAHLGPGYVDADVAVTRRRPQSARVGRSPRFAGPARGSDVPDVLYDTDHAFKATLATAVAQSHRRYSGMSAIGGPRFRKRPTGDAHLQQALANVDYDTNRGAKASIAQRVKQSGNAFKIVFDNRKPRFAEQAGDAYLRQALSAVQYDTDVAHKQTLATGVARSPRKISSMTSTTPRFRRAATPSGAGAHLGPGAIDVQRHAIEPHRPQPVLSTTERFPSTVDPSKNLGSTYRPARDKAHWNKGGVLSQTPRPPMAVARGLDKIIDVDSGHRMSLRTAVRSSPRRYSNVRSRTTRDVPPVAFIANDPRLMSAKSTCGEHLGPGAHQPVVMKNGFFNTISRRDDWHRGTPTFVSGTLRFGDTLTA